MPERISKREERRFWRPEMREDMFVCLGAGWVWLDGWGGDDVM